MKHARTLVAAALAAGPAPGDTFTVQPLGGPGDPVSLSSAGTQGVRPQGSFWSFPDVYTPAPDRATVLRVSPDGQWALGSDAVAALAARFSRAGAADIFPVSSTSTTPNAAYASSDGNTVVVGIGTSAGGSRRGFKWTGAGGTVDLGVLATDLTSAAVDVSGGGDVIVGYGDSNPPSSLRHPLIWTGGGGALSRLAANGGGFLGGEATAVSSNGQVVVGFNTRAGVQRGFRWTASGRDIDLGSPGNGGSAGLPTKAYDVSADGAWTVGEAQASGGTMQATMWNASGTGLFLADLLSAAGETSHELFDLRSIQSVSGNGRTVSGVCWDLSAGQFRAFVATLTFSTGGGCAPDLGGTGGTPGSDGVLDNNDFVVFVGAFFNQSASADFGTTGGAQGADGVFDNNDFVVFIDRFFTGCG